MKAVTTYVSMILILVMAGAAVFIGFRLGEAATHQIIKTLASFTG